MIVYLSSVKRLKDWQQKVSIYLPNPVQARHSEGETKCLSSLYLRSSMTRQLVSFGKQQSFCVFSWLIVIQSFQLNNHSALSTGRVDYSGAPATEQSRQKKKLIVQYTNGNKLRQLRPCHFTQDATQLSTTLDKPRQLKALYIRREMLWADMVRSFREHV